jgi:hypothetical protein
LGEWQPSLHILRQTFVLVRGHPFRQRVFSRLVLFVFIFCFFNLWTDIFLRNYRIFSHPFYGFFYVSTSVNASWDKALSQDFKCVILPSQFI